MQEWRAEAEAEAGGCCKDEEIGRKPWREVEGPRGKE